MLSTEIRQEARRRLEGNWGHAVFVAFVYILVAAAFSVSITWRTYAKPTIDISLSVPVWLGVLGAFILCVLATGLAKCFLAVSRGDAPEANTMFSAFGQLPGSFLVRFLAGLFVFLWSLLLVVPGIVKALSYAMAPYIWLDNPGMSALDAITASRKLMRGNKGRFFWLCLSFLGWVLLSAVTLGIAYLWVMPYMQTAFAAFYEDVRARAGEGGAAAGGGRDEARSAPQGPEAQRRPGRPAPPPDAGPQAPPAPEAFQ
jgi:uncharacterized membrane protein